jgi:hypothetical protein
MVVKRPDILQHRCYLRFDSYSAVILIAASKPAAVLHSNRTDSCEKGKMASWNFVRLSKKFFCVNKGSCHRSHKPTSTTELAQPL